MDASILREFINNSDGKYYPMEKKLSNFLIPVGNPLITFCAHLLQSRIFNIYNFLPSVYLSNNAIELSNSS